jgi:hypothetical protein
MNRIFVTTASILTATLLIAGAASVQGQTGQTTPPAKKTEQRAKPKLSPDQAYRANCTRCHSELPKVDPAAMKTILMHMRVRANMPKDQARAVVDYLTR